jgi:hypothetical protein
MSKIVLVVSKTPDPMKTMAVLRRAAPGVSVADLKQRLANGEPVLEASLFENDYPEVAARLRSLIRELPASGAELRLFELEPNEAFDKNADLSRWEIATDTLLNILDSAKAYK